MFLVETTGQFALYDTFTGVEYFSKRPTLVVDPSNFVDEMLTMRNPKLRRLDVEVPNHIKTDADFLKVWREMLEANGGDREATMLQVRRGQFPPAPRGPGRPRVEDKEPAKEPAKDEKKV